MTLTLIMIQTDFQSNRSIDGGTVKPVPPLAFLGFVSLTNQKFFTLNTNMNVVRSNMFSHLLAVSVELLRFAPKGG